MTDLEERLRATLSEAASHAPSADGLAAHVSHGRSRRRWVAALATAAAAAAVVLAFPLVSASLPAPNPTAPASATTTGPVTDPPGYQPSCAGTVSLVSSSGDRVILGTQIPVRMTMRVGDVLTIVADGPCESALSATPQSDGVLSANSADEVPNRFVAVAIGTVEVTVSHPMCANMRSPDPQCSGGVAVAGNAEITVTAR